MFEYLTLTYRVFIKYCVFSEDFKIFRTLAFLSASVCVHTPAGRKPALQQNLQSSEISQNFKGKIQYLMNTLYLRYPFLAQRYI